MKKIKLKDGLILTFRTMTWDDGWEFECPCMILAPIIHCYEQQSSGERMLEDVFLDACFHEDQLISEDFKSVWGWRYNLKYLQKVFRKSLAGHFFPICDYRAKQIKVKVKRVEQDHPDDYYWYYDIIT